MLEKVKKIISEYSIFYSGVTITVILAMAQLYAYLRKVYYYSYFNISSVFIEIDLYHDLSALFKNSLIIIIIISEIFLIDAISMIIYNNRKNLMPLHLHWKSIIGLILALIFLYLIIISGNVYIDWFITGEIIYSWGLPLVCFIIALSVRWIIFNARKTSELSHEDDKKIWRIFFVLLIAVAFICGNQSISDSALKQAANLKSFYVIDDSNIILYLTKDSAITAKYYYIEENDISINTNVLTKIDIKDVPLMIKKFDKVMLNIEIDREDDE